MRVKIEFEGKAPIIFDDVDDCKELTKKPKKKVDYQLKYPEEVLKSQLRFFEFYLVGSEKILATNGKVSLIEVPKPEEKVLQSWGE